MAYRICKSIELESGHLLSKHPGNCKFPHGHTRSVEMVFRADTLDANDMVVDFKAIKQMMGDFLQQFDHSLCVNTDDPNYAAFVAAYGERIIPFDREDPTSEVMARTIFNFARHALEKAREGSGEYPVRDCVTLGTRARVGDQQFLGGIRRIEARAIPSATRSAGNAVSTAFHGSPFRTVTRLPGNSPAYGLRRLIP